MTYCVYSDEGLVGEYDENGTEIRGYGYYPNSIWTTNPLFVKVGGSYFWYLNDHLGTPQMIVDSQGNVVWSAVYSAFGEARVDVELVVSNLRFPGQYFDAETGLHYNWWRYYDSETGRYLALDPLWAVNLYGYVGGNPVGFIDPTGLFSQEDAISLTLDLIPGVGSCKGIVEFIIGRDPITGALIPRWISILGIIPGGKYITKAGTGGEAIVYLYKGPDRHFSIVTKQGDNTIHTEQVVTSVLQNGKPGDTMIDVFTNDGTPIRNIFEFDLPDANYAQKFQKSLLNKDTGRYNLDTNSCLSHVCDTLKAGGVDVPIPDGSEKWKKEAYEFFLKNRGNR